MVLQRFLLKSFANCYTQLQRRKNELNKYLLQYHDTPHPTTGLSPAEMLYNHRIRTKLPQIFAIQESPKIENAREKHDAKKMIQKQHFDRRRNAQSPSHTQLPKSKVIRSMQSVMTEAGGGTRMAFSCHFGKMDDN